MKKKSEETLQKIPIKNSQILLLVVNSIAKKEIKKNQNMYSLIIKYIVLETMSVKLKQNLNKES